MISYVLGFAFTPDLKYVALIKKNGSSVPAHAGKLNGIGGKIIPRETKSVAMAREFEEETGVFIRGCDWLHKGYFFGESYTVDVFTTVSARVWDCETMEDEDVEVVPVDGLGVYPYDLLCGNVPALIQICLNPGIKNLTWEER